MILLLGGFLAAAGLVGLRRDQERFVEILRPHLTEIEMRELRLLAERRIVALISLGRPARQRIRPGQHDPADQLLQVEALLSKPLGEPVEQFRMRRRIVLAQIVDRPGESVSEEVPPHSVHNGLGHQWAGLHEIGKFPTAVRTEFPTPFDRAGHVAGP